MSYSGGQMTANAVLIATISDEEFTWAWADPKLKDTAAARLAGNLARFGIDEAVPELVRPHLPLPLARGHQLPHLALPILGSGRWRALRLPTPAWASSCSTPHSYTSRSRLRQPPKRRCRCPSLMDQRRSRPRRLWIISRGGGVRRCGGRPRRRRQARQAQMPHRWFIHQDRSHALGKVPTAVHIGAQVGLHI